VAEDLHVLFGGGQVGQPLARILLVRGKQVRIVKRSAGGVPDGVELVQGDAKDLKFCVEAAQGASTVCHLMNPPYYASIWAELLPTYMENLLAAAGRNSARLVVLDNVYMLGRPDGKPLDEDTPLRPYSRKGEVRARVSERMWEAQRRGDVLVTTGRVGFLRTWWNTNPRGGPILASHDRGQARANTGRSRCDSHVSLHSGRSGRPGNARVGRRRRLWPAVDASMCTRRVSSSAGGAVFTSTWTGNPFDDRPSFEKSMKCCISGKNRL
jgi:hypothetical protein